jgi:hypothetical protein
MAYEDEEYLKYSEQLRDAVFGLRENQISETDIMREVESAFKEFRIS